MKTLLAIVLLFNIVIFNVSAQTTKPNYIIKLELALITAGNNYQVDFTDSIKFKHPYIKSGKSLGLLTITNKAYPDCELKYYVYEYSNRDSITNEIFHFYTLSETLAGLCIPPIILF